MIVQVSADVRIRAEDGNNYTIEKRHVATKGKTAGKETWAPVGYYGSLGGAASALLNRHAALLVDKRSGKASRKLRVKLNEVTTALHEEGAAIVAAIKAAHG